MATGIIERNSIHAMNIPSGTDLNSLETTGFYMCVSGATASSLANCPVTIAFTMIVMEKSQATFNQMIIAVGSASGNIFCRTKTSAGWQSWFETALT